MAAELKFAAIHNTTAFLKKPINSESFHEVIDTLRNSHIHFALVTRPTQIFIDHVLSFWNTATVNEDKTQIQATVDGRTLTISEESIRRHLQLNDAADISENESMEIKMRRKHIKAFSLDIFGAGTDTSAITIEWALAELINHPNIMKKAGEEIDQIVGKNRLIQESDIPNLPYLQAIIKESLRLHPSAPVIQRQSIEDCTIGGYHIPAKTNILFNVWGLGRDPTYWEHPLEFRPGRFEEKSLDVRGQHFQLLPFGSGRRMCPGISLGLMMVHVTLGSMIQCFEWKAGKDGNLTSVDMEEGIGITLPRANPLVCVPVARLDPIPFSM